MKSNHEYIEREDRKVTWIAGYTCVNSLFKFDPTDLVWMEITGDAAGQHPISRNSPAFVVNNGRFYMFGGIELSSLLGTV